MSELRRKVLELYREVDAEVRAAGPVCVASGRCCRFAEWGHVLYISNLEADVLLSAAPPYETPVTREFCPFQKEKLCNIRRPATRSPRNTWPASRNWQATKGLNGDTLPCTFF
jgi:hypothetical protein